MVNNLLVEFQFDAGMMSCTPSIYSHLVNAGINSPTIVPIPVPFDLWGMGTNDVQGNMRLQVNRVDIGAVESPYEALIFDNGFEADD